MARSSSIAWLVLALAPLAHAGELGLRVPDGTPCGSEPFAAALRARLPGTNVTTGATTSAEAVEVSLARDDGQWSLTILAPGQPPLRRPLPPGDDCVALSEAAALIADRYLSSIEWTKGPVEVSRLPPPEPPPPLQLLVELGGGAGLGLTGVAPAGQLELGLSRGAWFAELSAAWLGLGERTLATSSAVPVTLAQQTGAAQLSLGRRLGLGPGHVRLELLGGAELFFVTASAATEVHPNPLPHSGTVVTPLGFAGARAGYTLMLSERWSLSLRVEARAHLGEQRFSVEGYSESLVTHPVDGEVTLAVGRLFF